LGPGDPRLSGDTGGFTRLVGEPSFGHTEAADHGGDDAGALGLSAVDSGGARVGVGGVFGGQVVASAVEADVDLSHAVLLGQDFPEPLQLLQAPVYRWTTGF
jgi:hypothetical protein